MHHFDAIIIGTGQAGPSLAFKLAASGQQVAIIEKEHFGGTCVNTGCTPTKTMVASAKVAHMARRASEYGVEIGGPVKVDLANVIARKNQVVRKSSDGLERTLRKNENITVIEGEAHFVSSHVIRVNDEEYTAGQIFINAGGRPRLPSEGYEGVPVMTNRDLMTLTELPKHLIVVGGSYIGLEFAQMFRRFGSEVTVIEMGKRIVRREDEDVSEALKEIYEQEGIKFRLQAECMKARMDGDTIEVTVECALGGPPHIRGSHILMAIGRVPNSDTLNLDAAGIVKDERGFIQVDDQCKTNVKGIWALGDINGQGAFTHTAYNDFEIVAANLLDDDPRRISDRILCYALYSDPALARIGITETQARESGKNILIGRRPMKWIARAKEKGETAGFIKILVDAESKRILGATILGIEGDEIIHSLLQLMYADQPYTVMSRAVHIHPTVSELLPTILQGLEPLE